MRLALISIFSFIVMPVYCQSNKNLYKLKRFIIDIYPTNESIIDVNHSIDTIIKLRNGNYFVLVINELRGVSNSKSGTYDCYEISNIYQEFQVEKSILNNSDNTGGMGMVDLTYQLVYLNNNNYLLIANKNIVNHGNYNLLTLIVNAEKKYLEILATNDYSGVTGYSSSNLYQISNLTVTNGIFKKLTFKHEKFEISKDDSNRGNITEKTYEIRARDFDFDLECITNIKLLNQKTKSLN